MTDTQTLPQSSVQAAVERVADILQGAIERRGIYAERKAPISARYVLYAMFDLDPGTYFAPENGEALALWAACWRQTRHDGTREHYRGLHDAVYRTLTEGLPGDWRAGQRYTSEQVRDVARRITY